MSFSVKTTHGSLASVVHATPPARKKPNFSTEQKDYMADLYGVKNSSSRGVQNIKVISQPQTTTQNMAIQTTKNTQADFM